MAPGVNLRGYGHYHETYEKVDGQWLITSSTLTRLREDIFNAVSLFISPTGSRARPEGRRACSCDERADPSVGEIVATLQNSRVQVEQGGRPESDQLVEALRLDAPAHPPALGVRTNSSTYQIPQNRIWFCSPPITIGLKQMVRDVAVSPSMRTSKLPSRW